MVRMLLTHRDACSCEHLVTVILRDGDNAMKEAAWEEPHAGAMLHCGSSMVALKLWKEEEHCAIEHANALVATLLDDPFW